MEQSLSADTNLATDLVQRLAVQQVAVVLSQFFYSEVIFSRNYQHHSRGLNGKFAKKFQHGRRRHDRSENLRATETRRIRDLNFSDSV